MKNRTLYLATSLSFIMMLVSTVLCISSVSAQSGKKSNSLLWEVSGNNLETSSYLFGTMHMVCEDDLNIREEIVEAVKSSDKVVFEIDMSDPAAAQKFVMENRFAEDSLSKGLSTEQKVELTEILQSNFTINLNDIEMLKPFMISSLIMQRLLPECKVEVVDLHIQKLATENKLETAYLETLAEQLYYFDKGLDQEALIKSLKQSSDFQKQFNQISTAYHNEDLKALKKLMYSDESTSEEFIKYLLIERNNNWLKVIPGMFEKEATFVSVGAAHLIGEHGLIEQLRNQGYTVRPITD